jgi:hypothetical protein
MEAHWLESTYRTKQKDILRDQEGNGEHRVMQKKEETGYPKIVEYMCDASFHMNKGSLKELDSSF